MSARPTNQRAVWLTALAVGLALTAGNAARADNIDMKLIQVAEKVMSQAREKGIKNLGVLKFQTKVGKDGKASFDAGVLNANMASRLEFALIMVNDAKNPMGITRNASQVAGAKDKNGNFLTDASRKALFDHDYPLAWGNTTVKVDRFLTGEVHLTNELRDTIVTIKYFDRANPTMSKDEVTLTVKTDRSILSDAGLTFSLAKRGAVGDNESIDDLAVKEAAARLDEKPLQPTADSIENLIGVKIFYDGKEQSLKTINGALRVDEPQKGTKIRFGLENKTNEKLGVVLRINGINTLQMEGPEKQIEECLRWVLDAKGKYEVDGFWIEKTKKVPFVVESPGALPNLDPLKMGLIEVAVFRQDPEVKVREVVSLRALTARNVQAKSLEEMQLKLLPLSTRKLVHRGIIAGGNAQEVGKLDEKSLDSPNFAGLMSIRYFP
jgi:hypothetical protein